MPYQSHSIFDMYTHKKGKVVLIISLLLLLTNCKVVEEPVATTTTSPQSFVPSEACIKVLRSNCNASQQEMLNEMLLQLDLKRAIKEKKTYPGAPPAFEALPKDDLGMINWIKAETYDVIKPRGTISGDEPPPPEGFLHNLIFLQTEVHMMADVIFPHGMHTHWLDCGSCHPKPFKKQRGGNNITMKEIIAGKWCGKCHGKVAFPPNEYNNCRRCHSLPKKSFGG